ncbi:DDE-type integrase/transposase/recombinase, partial [Vibrio parahaemolyticus]
MSDFKDRHFSGQVILWTVRWYWKPGWASSWQVDETYIRVKGRWMYLYRAITDSGETVDFYLS